MKPAKPELLAPAGSMESLYAAVRCGADAVYLGGRSFSARSFAHNFSEEELSQAVSYCKLYGVKVYQAINTIVFDKELGLLEKTVRLAARLGVDGIIVQDLGVAQIIKEICPGMPLHASTQMSVHTPDGALFLQKLGFKRVVLARELSLDEITQIKKASDIELEVFIHGALCMSVSGQCYFSAFLGSRSGNRGMCAQPCRLSFTPGRPGEEHALSLKDLCGAEFVLALAELGVSSFKIEGRMKRPEYVAAATDAYRRILDGQKADIQTLRAAFSRGGFTDGYLKGKLGKDMFGIRGKEDVVAFAGVQKKLKGLYKSERQSVSIDMEFEFLRGKPCRLTVTDGVNTVSEMGEIPEEAANLPLSPERIKLNLEKLGQTPYFAENIKINADEGLTLTVSKINALRRACTDKLSEKRSRIQPKDENPGFVLKIPASKRHTKEKSFWGEFEKAQDISDYAAENLSKIILPLKELLNQKNLSDNIRKKLIAKLPRAMFGKESRLKDDLKKLYNFGIKDVIVENISQLYTAGEMGLSIHGGLFLNIANSYSAQMLKNLGAESFLCSPELKLSDINAMWSEIKMGAVVYGRIPLMLTRNCPVKTEKGCAGCGKQALLYDRKRTAFPVRCSDGYREILNSVPIYMADRLDEIKSCDFVLLKFDSNDKADNIIRDFLRREKPRGKAYTRGLYYRGV